MQTRLAHGTNVIRWNAMGNFHFELNTDGVKELLRGPEMQAILQEYAEAVKGEYGAGAEVSLYVGANRANASVFQPANDFTNNLLKAVGRAKNG